MNTLLTKDETSSIITRLTSNYYVDYYDSGINDIPYVITPAGNHRLPVCVQIYVSDRPLELREPDVSTIAALLDTPCVIVVPDYDDNDMTHKGDTYITCLGNGKHIGIYSENVK